MTVVVRPVQANDPALLPLVAAQEVEVMARYGATDAGPGMSPGARCLLAELDGEPVGCVAVAPLGPRTGELKRMYVAPAARGRGVGRVLLEQAERSAADSGYDVVRLETGTQQPEATALYLAHGWQRIPCYGYFKDDPETICLEKRLASVASDA